MHGLGRHGRRIHKDATQHLVAILPPNRANIHRTNRVGYRAINDARPLSIRRREWNDRKTVPASNQLIQQRLTLHLLNDVRLESEFDASVVDHVLKSSPLISRTHDERKLTQLLDGNTIERGESVIHWHHHDKRIAKYRALHQVCALDWQYNQSDIDFSATKRLQLVVRRHFVQIENRLRRVDFHLFEGRREKPVGKIAYVTDLKTALNAGADRPS